MKDCLFVACCYHAGLEGLGFAAALVLLAAHVCTWAFPRLWPELRHEYLALLRPALHSPAGARKADQLVLMLKDTAAPLKIQVALYEDVPQALLQAVFVLTVGGNVFVIATLIFATVKLTTLLSLAVALKDTGTVAQHILSLEGSNFENVRYAALCHLTELGPNAGGEVAESLISALKHVLEVGAANVSSTAIGIRSVEGIA
eukprot:CAMPEP_0170311942 /NCGR_PEP_ID=MMETSP0116_2-20130129/56491_1 /TAXON_ID=400756 /ORGANISM="Durinskia baltica, Strain CSIRO CS-38" /LENGTH=201 /DNA_ID=CAMNT_0010564285 /DNA_START=45 /DNA_END=647 /DNA_ORIENTATION=+